MLTAKIPSRTPRPWALRSLPVFPPVALQAVELLESSDLRLPVIAALVRNDPGIAANILAVANSPPFRGHHAVEDLDQAIIRVGTARTANIILGLALMNVLPGFAGQRRCWEHSVVTARMSEDIAQRFGVPDAVAYTAGLLHGVGRLALATQYPDEYASMIEIVTHSGEYFDLLACERSLFDIDHCEAGAWLAESWGLPERLRSVILHLHADASPADDPLLIVVRNGCRIANVLGYQSHLNTPKPSSMELLNALGGDESDLPSRMAELRTQTKLDLALLTAQPPPSRPLD